MKHSTIASRWNADLIDQNYETWLSSPASLTPEWRAFFEGFELAQSSGSKTSATTADYSASDTIASKQSRLIGAIYAYRSIGHTIAKFNPLTKEAPMNPRLTLERLGLDEADLDTVFHTGNYLNGVEMTARELLERLDKTYCHTVGFEYIHIQETPRRRWLQARIEPECFIPSFSKEEKERIVRTIMQAEDFENFLQTRYVGQKRFSLEGGETLIACLESIFERCGQNNVDEIVMGMAHRGRLNVLANFLGKSFEYIFREFSENYIPDTIHGDGDVKYHLGFETKRKTSEGHPVEIRLAANPSHLEAVDPVVEGKARARQRIIGDTERKRVLPVLIHGDAAIAGQGVVSEVFNFSQLPGYRTGGTIHLVVNNQIGFTTGPDEARSSRYCTDVAKIVDAPIFHVNGNDPLATIAAIEAAFDYRQTFGSDVVIDMYCWRKHGHNESDEPAFTQPTLYKKISSMQPIGRALGDRLVASGEFTREEIDTIESNYHARLEAAYEIAKKEESLKGDLLSESTAKQQPPYNFKGFDTRVPKAQLKHIAERMVQFPEGFNANKKIIRQLNTKLKAFNADSGIDWGMGEALAFGSLLMDGTPVRLSGQDSERGTFSHRHSVLYDNETRERYVPLLDLKEGQAQFCVHNSLLSEAAVLGFDYGYSLDYPQMLSMWEAQFGDFVNGAQVIIDQFLTCSESKWGRLSGLVMLLPHGYEGQGPEHSSARLERFLQACAENNIQVCNLTTPAQYFHVLRRQMKREFKKPLIIMAPKSLLRHKDCVSKVEHFTDNEFWSILDDETVAKKTAKSIVFCSGKVYYDLIAHRDANDIKDTAIVRIEQFYPLNTELLKRITANYPKAKDIVWCQEEPKNMGGWTFIAPRLMESIEQMPRYAGRDEAASPAVGSLALHKREQAKLVKEAFGA
ncbi:MULTISPECIES: 2-oxoglutarate dehydrogenase E1 component [unclassified Lentimonas]|uniref:2-oxoglutarate dehydrogenase E1 component n=1 Tax=unclassified Lentimonas TaxID=2630993 RepID=UPI0013249C49|nr:MULTISPECIES: 2-oxoglutarate dehydrogenase E1 component [unclassified Lentimonas]CAA6677919.1 2-oxoglutarate dehydrogenase E1 component (EC [Lentimonas sp. CC4]CAA6684023.1 2-oxoglutarate dehydrogenase E1 component (EC [Lentimonas sp. CC6]CAA7076601.1 2-oxoglutarate dehydrogenase E1 component (EC [Lentimonas sp. CC4]CAA7170070.1 2-oxoglutarate dehydrogenase E1 component (EC [Lentimonas sp. CC21]CAA7181355.1 2-oxoglutarate dehydrogenase E1 component (EC [Lentimonas sp. CC8]